VHADLVPDGDQPAEQIRKGSRDRARREERAGEQRSPSVHGHRPRAHELLDEAGIEEAWLTGAETVGLTSGASVPDHLVRRVCEWFRARGAEVPAIPPVFEDVFFRLPVEVRRIVPAA